MDLKTFLRLYWDRVAGWSCASVGAIILLVGWAGASGSAYPAEQIPYVISGGIGGMLLVGWGATMWLSADLRDEWRKLHRLELLLQDNGGALAAATADGPDRTAGGRARKIRRSDLAEASEAELDGFAVAVPAIRRVSR